MKDVVIKKINEVYFHIGYDDIGIGLEMKSYFSCYAPNFKFHPKFKARMWDGKISYFNMMERTLPIGLLTKLMKFCKEFGYSYEFDFDATEFRNDIVEQDITDFAGYIMQNKDIKLRDYQLESVFKSIKNKRGIVLSPTGSGKSLTIYTIIRFLQALDKKVMLVVPNVSLVEQMYADFVDYGWNDIRNHVSKLHGTTKADFTKNILITTWQSIYKKNREFFVDYDALLIDETHTAKSLSLQNIAKNCINAEYRLGFTGTLPTEQSELYTIKGFLGPVMFEMKSKDLMDKGILSQISIANIIMKYPEKVRSRNVRRPYPEEIQEIINYKPRNKGLDFVMNHIKEGQNTLILCHLIDHIEAIEKYLFEKYGNTHIIKKIYGKISATEREEIRNMMEQEENFILLGTYATMSTGINIKRIHHVVFASSYKSKIKILQSIGRGLRKHESKEQMVLWDLVDDLRYEGPRGGSYVNHVFKHFDERMRFYKEQEFKHFTKHLDI